MAGESGFLRNFRKFQECPETFWKIRSFCKFPKLLDRIVRYIWEFPANQEFKEISSKSGIFGNFGNSLGNQTFWVISGNSEIFDNLWEIKKFPGISGKSGGFQKYPGNQEF